LSPDGTLCRKSKNVLSFANDNERLEGKKKQTFEKDHNNLHKTLLPIDLIKIALVVNKLQRSKLGHVK
jgi:hypothetical protein